MTTPLTEEPPSENTPIANTVVSMPEDEPSSAQRQAAALSPSHNLRTYRGGFHTSICDIFRDPHRRTDCCAVACCGVLSSDRSRYLLTGKRPPPLWIRMGMYLLIPVLFIAAMNYWAVDVPVGDDGETQKAAPAEIFWPFVVYLIALITYGFVVSDSLGFVDL